MSEPFLQSPLHHLGLAERARKRKDGCGVIASEIPLRGYLSLRGDARNSDFLARVAEVLEVSLPTEPCTLASSADLTVLWLSPDEWLIAGTRANVQRLADALGSALAGVRSQVVVNSGGYTEIRLAGRNAADVLSHCTVYDISSLTPGRVVGSTFGKASVYMFRSNEAFQLLVRRSFADYIWRFMERAATPYGFGVASEVVPPEQGGRA